MTMDDSLIYVTKCDEEKDLGVIFDKELLFDKHITKSINKANSMIGLIRRTFSFLDKDTFLRLYKTLIRPIIEYGNSVWFPNLKRQSVEIEKVQRRATKLVHKINHLQYYDRLKYLQLPSLKARRIRGDLIQTYEIINNIDDTNKEHFF